MVVKYKIVEINENNHCITVRYYTDKATEEKLASDDTRKENGTPVRARSDLSITIPIPIPDEEMLENIIISNCPFAGLKHFEQVLEDEKSQDNFIKAFKDKIDVEKTFTEEQYHKLLNIS